MSILIAPTISWTCLLKTTEQSDLVKDWICNLLYQNFVYDDYITKQSFDLSSQLRINQYEMHFVLDFVTDIMEKYKNSPQSAYMPIPEPITITSSQQSALFLLYSKD